MTTVEEIDAAIRKLLNKCMGIETDKRNRNPHGSFYTYIPAARKRLDKLRMEIAYVTGKRRALQGNPVSADGYSGRNSNK